MAQSYTRQSSFSDGDTITAALFNNEYDQLVNAFAYSSSSASSTGHRHDGTAAHGGNIHTIGDLDFLNKIVADSTNNRWGVFVEVSSAAVEQIRIQDGAIVPVTDNDIDLGTSSLEFKDAYFDGTITTDGLTVSSTTNLDGAIQVDNTITVGVDDTGYDVKFFGDTASAYMLWDTSTDDLVLAGAAGLDIAGDIDVDGTANLDVVDIDGAVDMASTLAVTGAVTGSSTIQGTTITATTAFVPDASDGAALGTSALEFSDLFLADGAVINFGDDQDVSLTHVADTGLLISSTDQLQFGDSGTYIYQSADGVLDLVSDTEIELTATTIDINGAVAMDGAITGGTNITISGELDAATLDISGNADIDGTLEADAYTIDGTALNEYIADTVGAMVSSNTETDITVTYDDGDNTLDFVVGNITGTAALATSVTASANNSTDETVYPTFVDGATGTQGIETDTGLTYNPSSGILTGTQFTGAVVGNVTGNASGTALTVTQAAQSAITSLGTLTSLTVDDVAVDGKVITMTGSASDTAVFTAGTNGTLSIVTTDAAAAAANIQITADGTVDIDSAGVLTLDSGAAINIEPASGSAILLDGTISIDAGVVTGATAITLSGELDAGSLDVSGDADIDGTLEADAYTVDGTALNEYIADTVGAMVGSNTETNITVTYEDGDNTLDFVVGTLNQDTTGTADNITISANNSTDETVYPIFVDGATGSQGAESDTGLTYNPSSGLLTISGELDAGSLDISGNADIDGTLEADAITVDGTTLAEYIADTSGAMFSSNTESGITATYQDGDNTVDLAVDAAQPGRTSIYATDLILGEDSQTAIDFGTANEIDFKADNAARLTLTSGALYPVTDNEIDLGTSSLEFKDAFFDGTVTSDAFAGPLTGDVTGTADLATSITVSANNSTDETVYPVFVDGATGTQGAETDTGFTYNPSSGLLTIAGELDAGSLDISGNVDIDGTLETDNLTVGGAQGSDGQVLTSTGSGVAWESAGGGGASDIDGLSDCLVENNSIWLGNDPSSTTSTAAYSVALGTTALDAATTGDYNVALGYNAATALTTGGETICIGASAGAALSTGGNNLAIGHQALVTATTSSYNLAIGRDALNDTTTGNHNVAIGHWALDANTTASGNIAIGYDALGVNTTGATNIAIGDYALDANTTASNNVAVGTAALGANSTGYGNTALGTSALASSTTAYNNVIIGHYAGDALTTGYSNVAIGYNCMGAMTTGGNNVAIGDTCFNTANSASATQNVFVGQYVASGAVANTGNVGVGYLALNAATSGIDNTCVGRMAGDSITTSGANVLIGAYAGQKITTGDVRMVAVGFRACEDTITATGNTGVGQYALTNAVEGYNTGLGAYAGDTITTGQTNTCIGYGADTSASGGNNQNVFGGSVVSSGDGTFTFGHGTTDTACTNGNTVWSNPSDIRLKEDIQDEVVGLDFINELRPVTFRWKKEKDVPEDLVARGEGSEERVMDGKYNHGFVAQEVKEVIDNTPELKEGFELWREDDADGRQRIGESALIPMLVKSIQELSAEVEDLKKKAHDKCSN